MGKLKENKHKSTRLIPANCSFGYQIRKKLQKKKKKKKAKKKKSKIGLRANLTPNSMCHFKAPTYITAIQTDRWTEVLFISRMLPVRVQFGLASLFI